MSPFVGSKGFPRTPEGDALAQAESERTGIPITDKINPDGWGRVGAPHVEAQPGMPTPGGLAHDAEHERRLAELEAAHIRLKGELYALRTAVEDVVASPPKGMVQALDQQPEVDVGYIDLVPRYSQEPADYGEVEGDEAEDPPKGRHLTAHADETVGVEDET